MLCRKSKVPDFAFYKNIDKGIFDHNFFLGVCGNFNKLIYKSSNVQSGGVSSPWRGGGGGVGNKLEGGGWSFELFEA